MQLEAVIVYPIPVVRVYNEDNRILALIMVRPTGTGGILSTNIPDGEREIFVFHSRYIETGCWNCYIVISFHQFA